MCMPVVGWVKGTATVPALPSCYGALYVTGYSSVQYVCLDEVYELCRKMLLAYGHEALRRSKHSRRSSVDKCVTGSRL